MDKLLIEGGHKLSGSVDISGAKNASLPIMAASLLFKGPIKLSNLPGLSDIRFFKQILESLGAKIDGDTIDCSQLGEPVAEYDLVRKMRASVLVLGPLLARFKKAKVSLPGGCAIGARPIDLHIKGLEKLGAIIEVKNGYVEAYCEKLKGEQIYLDFASVGATENIMMAACLAEGETVIHNAAVEPEVLDLIDFLRSGGVSIQVEGQKITITGTDFESLNHSFSHKVIPDRIETATFIIAALMTNSSILINKAEPSHLKFVLNKLKQMGAKIEVMDESIKVLEHEGLCSVDITTDIYPGFPTDIQAQMVTLLGFINGESHVEEKIFENRFMHVPELNRLGMDISLSGNTARIKGVQKLQAAPVMCTDLRASAALVLAALVAKGQTCVNRIYHLDRGYQNIEKKLSDLGAKIKRVRE